MLGFLIFGFGPAHVQEPVTVTLVEDLVGNTEHFGNHVKKGPGRILVQNSIDFVVDLGPLRAINNGSAQIKKDINGLNH